MGVEGKGPSPHGQTQPSPREASGGVGLGLRKGVGSQQRVASPPAAISHCTSRHIYGAQTADRGRRPRGPGPVPRSPCLQQQAGLQPGGLNPRSPRPRVARAPCAPTLPAGFAADPRWAASTRQGACGPQQAKQEPCPHALEGPRAAFCQSLMFSGRHKHRLAVAKPGPGPASRGAKPEGRPSPGILQAVCPAVAVRARPVRHTGKQAPRGVACPAGQADPRQAHSCPGPAVCGDATPESRRNGWARVWPMVGEVSPPHPHPSPGLLGAGWRPSFSEQRCWPEGGRGRAGLGSQQAHLVFFSGWTPGSQACPNPSRKLPGLPAGQARPPPPAPAGGGAEPWAGSAGPAPAP